MRRIALLIGCLAVAVPAVAQSHPCDVPPVAVSAVAGQPFAVGFCHDGLRLAQFAVTLDQAIVFTGPLQPQTPPNAVGLAYYETPKTIQAAVGSYTVTVAATSPEGLSASASLALTVVSTTAPTVIHVSPIGDLQTALNECRPGDIVQLQAGGVYTGSFVLPAKASPGCALRSSATLPERRIAPEDAGLLPILRSGSSSQAALSGVNAAFWTLDGLAFESNPLGEGDVIVLHDAQQIVLDRILLVAGPDGQKRAIRGNGTQITLTRSHLAGIWKSGQDSQAFCAWDGAGPYTLTNNYLEAASENVMFGGSDSGSAERIPADILIDGNYFSKPISWYADLQAGFSRNVKNLLELKQAKRVTIRNNVFEHSWVDGQGGAGILFSTMNDDGGSPWAVVEDVLFENNLVRGVVVGLGIVGRDSYHVSGQGTRFTIRNNDFQTSGNWLHVSDNAGVVTVEQNRVQNGGFASYVWGSPYAVEDYTFRNNTLSNPAMGWDGEGCPSCTTWEQALPRFVKVFNGQPTTTDPEPPPPPPPPPPSDTTAPAVSITGVKRSGKSANYTITATASDAVGVVRVEFLIDGGVVAMLTAEPYTATVKITQSAVVTVRAIDAAGNVGSASWSIAR